MKQVGSIRMSTKHPTLVYCLRDLSTRSQQRGTGLVEVKLEVKRVYTHDDTGDGHVT